MESKAGIRIILDFTACVDISLGMLRYLKFSDKFDKKYFDENVTLRSDAYLKHRIISSKEKNPLSIIFKEEYHDSIDSLYQELIEKHYKDIMMTSTITDIYRLSLTIMKAKDVSNMTCTINCHTDLEAECISKILGSDNKYPVVQQVYDMDEYDTLFIMNRDEVDKYKNLDQPQKAVYLGNKAYNFDKGLLAPDLVKKIFPCLVYAADIYVGYTYLNREGMSVS